MGIARGVQVHVVSLQGSLTINLLLPGYAHPHLANQTDNDQLLLVLHTPTQTQTAPLHPTSSVYSISPSNSSTTSLSTRQLYSLPDTTLMSKQCLHPDKSKFLFFSPSSSSLTSARPSAGSQDETRRKSTFGPRVKLLHLSTGLALAQFSLTSPLPLAQMGFFSSFTVFMLHKATYIDSAILVFFDLKGEVKSSLNLPTPFTHQFFSTFSSLLLTPNPSPAPTLSSAFLILVWGGEEEDGKANTNLSPWTISHNMQLGAADPSSLGGQISTSIIKLINFI